MPDLTARGQVAGNIATAEVPWGVGFPLAAIPAGSANGTPIPFPTGLSTTSNANTCVQGIRFYIPAGASFSIAISNVQPVSAPVSFTINNASSNAASWDEALYDQNLIYITGTNTGTVLYRWI